MPDVWWASGHLRGKEGDTTTEHPYRADHIEALRRTIAASGLSARRWACDVVMRDERTVRRWLAGDSPIPQAVLAYLDRIPMKLPQEGQPVPGHTRLLGNSGSSPT